MVSPPQLTCIAGAIPKQVTIKREVLMKVKSKYINNSKKYHLINSAKRRALSGLIPLMIIIGVGIITAGSYTMNNANALTYQSPVDMQFTFNPTVSINVSGDLIIPDLAPGSSSDSNIITITAGSNDAHGYKLYGTVGSSSSNYTDLRLSSSNTTNVFTNLSSNKAALSNFSDNTWGYSYSTDSGSSWVSGSVGSTSSGYNGLPLYNSSNNASGVILASTSSASETSLQFKIGAKAASTQVSGTYTNTINFIGVGNVVTTTYSLNYVDASGEGTGLPASLSSQTTNDGVITLSDTTPTRTDYIFKGWCDTNNSSDPTTCTGTTYNPGRIYIIPAASQGGTVTVNMYAIWESATPETTIANATYMQEVSSCPDTLTTGQVYSLKDSRDEQSYNVAKLADGNCWLLDNLALDLTSSTVLSAMDSTNTNASNTTLGYLKNGGGTTSDQYATTAVANWTSSYSYSAPLVNMSYKDTIPSDATSTAGDYKVGGYYNYCAASAGSYCYGNGTSQGTSSGDATESICPKGWRLPTDNTSGEYQALYSNSNYNTYANYRAALHLPLSGYFYNGSPVSQGRYGYFWSSTRVDNYGMYVLYLERSDIIPADYHDRYSGYSVRCVLDS